MCFLWNNLWTHGGAVKSISSATIRLERELVVPHMAKIFHSHIVLHWQLRLCCPAGPSTSTELTLHYSCTRWKSCCNREIKTCDTWSVSTMLKPDETSMKTRGKKEINNLEQRAALVWARTKKVKLHPLLTLPSTKTEHLSASAPKMII